MISYQEAMEKIMALETPQKRKKVPLMDSEDCYLAGPVEAPWDLPRFDNSAMDGYAFHSDDIGKVEEFKLVGESAAGHAYSGRVERGEIIAISTGAEVPAGLDTIAPIEICEKNGNTVRVTGDVEANRFIRFKGSDVKKGQKVFQRGTRIDPETIGFLSFYNIPEVEIIIPPKVAILTSGDEIIPYGETPTGSQIIGSSLYALERKLRNWGCETRLLGIAKDELSNFLDLMKQALGWADIIVTTAGVSVGPHDLMSQVIEELNGDIHFWRVAVRPGKPMLLATYGKKVHFGFPGNPVSTSCNSEIFLKPFLEKWFGKDSRLPLEYCVPLATDCPRDKRRHFYVYAQKEVKEGTLTIRPLENQNSGNILNPALADALISVSPGPDAIPEGELVRIIDLKA